MNLSRIRRLLKLIALIQGGKGHNAPSLADECKVTRRTVFRDLDLLRKAGVPLLFDEEAGRYLLRGDFFLPPATFTPEEALALMVLCHDLGNVRGVPFYEAASKAALKLEGCLPYPLREQIRKAGDAVEIRLEPTAPLADHESDFRLLQRAIEQRNCARIDYDSLTEWQVIRTKINPYRLLFSRRGWYVIGRSSLHRAVRTFNLGRIRKIEILEDRFQIPRGFSLERYIRNAWHLIPEPGPDTDVTVRFQPKVARNVAEVQWHKSQRTFTNPDGTLDFRVRVSGLGEISWWILGYGDQAEVIRPEKLRNLVIRHCRNMLERYEKQGLLLEFNPAGE